LPWTPDEAALERWHARLDLAWGVKMLKIPCGDLLERDSDWLGNGDGVVEIAHGVSFQ